MISECWWAYCFLLAETIFLNSPDMEPGDFEIQATIRTKSEAADF
jgi:hypothetical protein